MTRIALGAYTAQTASPPGALAANTDSASAGTRATGRPGALTARLPTPQPFHSTSPPSPGGPPHGRLDGGRAARDTGSHAHSARPWAAPATGASLSTPRRW